MLTVLTVLIILAVGYAHMRDGLYTALCMFINSIIAGIVAFGFFEPVADWLENTFQGGFFAGYEDFLSLLLIFAATMIALRMITNRLAPEMLDLPANAQYGGAVLGLVTGYFLSGFLICAMETLPWHENFFDFRPRVSNDSGPRSIFPPDRLWLAMMRYIGAHGLAWEEDDQGADNRYDRYKTFDRYGTFEQRYLRYRRFSDGTPPSAVGSGGMRSPLKYQMELERELYKLP